MSPVLATDPPVSEKQRRAMEAAAHGHSTLGIPKAVGEEYVGKDATAGHAAAVMFVAPSGEVLLLHRSPEEKNFGSHWGLPGGKAEDGEGPEEAADREVREEIGGSPKGKRRLLDSRVTPTGMGFHTFAQPVAARFHPRLTDGEHTGFTWAHLDALPRPMHPGVENTIRERLAHGRLSNDMTPEDWSGLREGFLKWVQEEEAEPEHAMDRAMYVRDRVDFAYDRSADKSVRAYDLDGRLRVARTPISKANVCPYLGKEIPKWQELGLDPAKIYQLLRDPEELKKGAGTFNGIQLMVEHVPVNAKKPETQKVIGTTGTEAEFEEPYLYNSLVVWVENGGIADIEDETKKELSSSYRYRADMTPGSYRGQRYDGVMRDIIGNHVALVKEGRAGSDVVVGDAAIPQLKELHVMTTPVLTRKAAMVQGALAVFLAPMLAKDAKLDLSKVLNGVTHKDFKEQKGTVAIAATALAKPHLKPDAKFASDATVEGLHALLDGLEPMTPAEGADTDPNSGLPMGMEEMRKKTMDADPFAKLEELLRGKVDDATMAAVKAAMSAPVEDETPEMKMMREKKEAEDKARDEELKAGKANMVSKPAMDAALKANTEATERRILAAQASLREAERFVKPWMGDVVIACDSAEAVHRQCLKVLGVEVEKDLDPRAFPAIIRAQPVPGAKRANDAPYLGMDSAQAKSYAERFPQAGRISVIG